MAEEERFIGNAQFNMGVASMQRMDTILRSITQLMTILYYKGQPLHQRIILLQQELYAELYPYLTDTEIQEAEDNFLSVFENDPIRSDDSGTIIPNILRVRMNEFRLWMMKKLREKGILQRFEEDPGEAIL